MQLVTPIKNLTELNSAHKAGIQEILLGHVLLSTLGNLNTESMHTLASEAKNLGMKPVILWDILMRDPEMDLSILTFQQLDPNLFSAVRVLDPGALEYVIQKSSLPIQLILRTGNHNLKAILGWISSSLRIEKVVLSSELPKKRIEYYAQNIPVATEVLGLVPILLFYTPRYLLSYQNSSDSSSDNSSDSNSALTINEDHLLTAMASCEETTHRGFRVVESRHGTLMFHEKDYSLLANVEELKDMGVSAFQMDFRLEKSEAMVCTQMQKVSELCQNFNEEKLKDWAQTYPNKTTRCFYQANATDVLFKKLKNTPTQRVDQSFIGEVVETVKDKHTIVHVTGFRHSLAKGSVLKILTPMGKSLHYKVNLIRDLDGNVLEQVAAGDYAVLPFLRSVMATSVLYHEDVP